MITTNTKLTEQELTLNHRLLQQHWEAEIKPTSKRLERRWEMVDGVLVGKWIAVD
ncbi:MAG: hypothetical protein AAGG02_18985 [Cyanobacteria bacterium P01_H01_bin.15]